MTNEVYIVGSAPDLWARSLSIATVLVAGIAIIFAWLSYRLSIKISQRTALENSKAAKINRLTSKANIKAMALQKDLFDHQVKHDRLSVKPALQVIATANRNDETKYVGFYVKNTGLGPLRMAPPLLWHDHHNFGPMSSVRIKEIKDALDRLRITNSCNINFGGLTLLPGESRAVITFSKDKVTDADCNWIKKIYPNLNITVPYSSMYEDEIMWAALQPGLGYPSYPNLVLNAVWPHLFDVVVDDNRVAVDATPKEGVKAAMDQIPARLPPR